MYIKKIKIENFKCIKGEFSLELNKGLNVIVGNNEAGKSTILESVHLALSGLLNGKYFKSELTQDLFNNEIRNEYLDNLKKATPKSIPLPPHILIEIFIEDIEDESLKALFEGDGNSTKKKACGIQLKIALNELHKAHYEELVNCGNVQSIPIEYYDFSWSSFARDEKVTPTTIPIKSAMIDSSSNKYKNGSDVYISLILRDHLEPESKIKIDQAYRRLKDKFMEDESVKLVNEEINNAIDISDKNIKLSLDLSSKNTWETSLVTYLDEVPFNYIGKGEQCIIKTKLALKHKKAQEANILLLEEPENHLSHTKLNQLIKYIKDSNNEKQIIISTHSSFVANKLGLVNLILLNVDSKTKQRKETRLDNLKPETKNYFEKLSGYDTLRLILCKKAILVEGDSDELIVQKAYRINNSDKLPIHDEIDVISVGTSFLRFLEIAEKIEKPVNVITDNDGDVDAIKEKYQDYLGRNKKTNIKICFDDVEDSGNLKIGKNNKPFNYNTLEPKILKANNNDISIFNKIFNTKCKDLDEMHKHMKINKTDCALQIFDNPDKINYPEYILDGIK